jgi:hypothetical protein
MIPFSEMKQTLGRRNNTFDSESAHFDMLESDYTLLNPRVRKPVHEDVIKGPFTRRLGCFTSIMMGEITHSMDHLLGADQREVEIKVYDAMAEVIACTANRVFVGETLCMSKHVLHLLWLGAVNKFQVETPTTMPMLSALQWT